MKNQYRRGDCVNRGAWTVGRFKGGGGVGKKEGGDTPMHIMFFISTKKLFLFARYSIFCNFSPSIAHFPASVGQMDVE